MRAKGVADIQRCETVMPGQWPFEARPPSRIWKSDMRAERMPHQAISFVSRGLRRWVELCTAYPAVTIALGLLATLAAGGLAATQLRLRTSRAELLCPQSDYNRRWLSYTAEFGDKEDVVLVVEGTRRELLVPVLDYLAETVSAEPQRYQDVLHRYDLTKVGSKGLHYLDFKQLDEIEGFLRKAEPILHGDWAQLNLGNLAGWMEAGIERVPPQYRQHAIAAMQAELARTAEGLAAALGPTCSYKSPWPDIAAAAAAIESLGSNYMITDDGRLGFVILKFAQTDTENLAQNSDAVDRLREIIAAAQQRFPDVHIGLTGLPIIENDEMRASQFSSSYTTVLSFIGVFAIILLAFGGARHVTLIMTALAAGTVWACGAAALAVGHLNLLSASFGSILFGLGIDYGIAYLSAYLNVRKAGRDVRRALLEAAEDHGPAIAAAAVTSAVAFFMVGLTEFRGIAQLGVIAGMGLLLCWIASMSLLPALVLVVDRRRADSPAPVPLQLGGLLQPLTDRPYVSAVGLLLTTAGLALGARHLWYDYNLLNLQPDGMESVALEHKLLQETNLSASFALSVSDSPQELLERKQRFLALPSVERVEEISSLFPAFGAEKQAVIARMHQQLAVLPREVPQIPVVPQENLAQILERAQGMLAMTADGSELSRRLQLLRDAVRALPTDEYLRRMTHYQQAMANDLLGRLHALRAVSNPEPPSLADLPGGLTTRFVGKTGKHVQKIYAKVNIWDNEGMEQFVREVRSVDPDVTGNPIQIFEASRHMKASYQWAAWATCLVLAPVLFLHFRRFTPSLLAILPLACGLAQMLGLMGALDIALNPANMIVLPFLFGMGLDNGMHVMHDYEARRGRYRGMSQATGLTVLVNSLTTMVGFAALMLATHKGLQSLGRVLVIGMSCCLISTLLLPNLLVIYDRWSRRRGSSPADAGDDEDENDRDAPPDADGPLSERTDESYSPAQPIAPRHAA